MLATSPKTRGGITSVLNCYKKQPVWNEFACRWISTHRDGSKLRKLAYLIGAWGQFICLLPFYDVVHIHVGLRPSMLRKYPFFLLARALRKKTVVHLHCGSQLDSIWNRRYSKVFTRADRVLYTGGCPCAYRRGLFRQGDCAVQSGRPVSCII